MDKSKHKKPDPQKWTEVYPYGTPEGDEEAKFFRCLARHPKFDSQSTAAIIKATGLTRERVEEIIDKYATQVKPALIYPHPTNEDQWCYWELCPDVLNGDLRDLSTKDKDSRIDNYLNGSSGAKGTPSMEGNLPSTTILVERETMDTVSEVVHSEMQSLDLLVPPTINLPELNLPPIVLDLPASSSVGSITLSYYCC